MILDPGGLRRKLNPRGIQLMDTEQVLEPLVPVPQKAPQNHQRSLVLLILRQSRRLQVKVQH